MVYARDFYLSRVSSVPVFKQDKYKVGIFGRLLMLLIVSSACRFMNAFSAGVFSSVFARKTLSPLSPPTATCCHPTFCCVCRSIQCGCVELWLCLSQGETRKCWYIILEKMVRARSRGWAQQWCSAVPEGQTPTPRLELTTLMQVLCRKKKVTKSAPGRDSNRAPLDSEFTSGACLPTHAQKGNVHVGYILQKLPKKGTVNIFYLWCDLTHDMPQQPSRAQNVIPLCI